MYGGLTWFFMHDSIQWMTVSSQGELEMRGRSQDFTLFYLWYLYMIPYISAQFTLQLYFAGK